MSKTQERRPKSAINKNISANQLAESLLKNAKDSYKK